MVCDLCDLNRITIKNKACLQNVDDLFDAVQGSAYFSKLDLHSGYNQFRIRAEYTRLQLTPIWTLSIPSHGIWACECPATFQSIMNDILRPHPRKFIVFFLDDILIVSRTLKEHLEHICVSLSTLRHHQLFCKPLKCHIGSSKTLFLGHEVSGTNISPDS